MSRLGYMLEPRLPQELCGIVSSFLSPLSALPPQLVKLSQSWGRLVVGRVEDDGKRLSISLASDAEVHSSTGLVRGTLVSDRYACDMSEEELEEHDIDPWEYLHEIKISTWEIVKQDRIGALSAEAFPHAFDDMVDVRLDIAIDDDSARWLQKWREKHGRRWPMQSDGRIHHALSKAWADSQHRAYGFERAILAL
jgi:hypothetical protein